MKAFVVITPTVFEDDRGYFFESYSEAAFANNGIHLKFIQDNQSFSKYAVIRGLHLQAAPCAQSKLVRVLQGEILDVAVDIRKDSPTYGKDLVQAILAIIIKGNWQGGIYHYSNEGDISWHEFALAIKEIAQLDCEISGIPSSQFPTPAKRPAYSLLDTSKIKATYGLSVANYRRSLALCLNNILS